MIPPPTWEPTDAEYHALDGRWSSSMIEQYRQSPLLAFQRYVERSIPPDEDAKHFRIGRAFHAMLPGGDPSRVVMVDVGSTNAKAYKAALEAADENEIVLTRPEFDSARGMALALEVPQSDAAERAAQLLSMSDVYEYAVQWDEEIPQADFVIPGKLKVDKLVVSPSGITLLDPKSSADPRPWAFGGSCAKWGYVRRLAWYRRGLESVGIEVENVVLVAVGSSPPHDVGLYPIDEATMDEGEDQLWRTLERLAESLKTGRWQSKYQDIDEQVPALPVPTWSD